MPGIYFVGVDVGTGSARAALVNAHGRVQQMHVKAIQTWNPLADHYEQSSEDIWNAVCECVRTVTQGYPQYEIAGIGFDATCSLVAIDADNNPLTVSTTGNNNQNVILWMDHRAGKEATRINETKHELLNCVGGKVSLEMQCPKLLWLKENLYKSCWSRAGKLFDLPDYLTWKCTRDDTRSLCSVVCKWNYDGVNGCWSTDFLEQIGLDDLCKNNFEILGRKIREPGASVGRGLTECAAKDLGLLAGTPVAASMIDAHAGALCLFGCHAEGIDEKLESKMALICGTSSCHMSVEKSAIWANGIWGPYNGAVFPGMFLHEGGQSASGILLDFVVKNHPAYEQALASAGKKHVTEYLNNLLSKLASERDLPSVHHLTQEFHVWPDYHGNRSPIADPSIKGMISGLTMTPTEENLAVTYLAFVQAIAYGTKHILDVLKESGRTPFSSLLICGGLSKNPLFIETHAEACALPILVPNETEMVLVGSAMLAACGSKVYGNLEQASKEMGSKAQVVHPTPALRDYHERKYKVFREMLNDQLKYNKFMAEQ